MEISGSLAAKVLNAPYVNQLAVRCPLETFKNDNAITVKLAIYPYESFGPFKILININSKRGAFNKEDLITE